MNPIFKHELGKQAQDTITGFKGIIVARAEHITGCNQYGITPQVLKDGKRMDTEWFDEDRLKITGKGITAASVQGKKPGCEHRTHP